MSTTRKMKFSFLVFAALVLIVSFSLASCGGGGGGTTPAPTYSVTYDGNGNTGGGVPTDTATYGAGQTVTVLGNTGTVVKTGYAFTGWNSAADGTGTTYAQSQTFTMGSANVTLYAAWTTNPTYTVTYNGNGNTGGSVPTDSTNYEAGQTVTVLGNPGNLTKTNYTFGGWNTLADGTGTTYGATFAMGSANVTLYAKWALNWKGTKQLGVAGGTVNTEGHGVAVDGSGNVYVAGSTWGGLDGNMLTGTQDIFVTKYDSSGNKVRTKQLGVAGKYAEAYGVAGDADGNVYVAGYTTGGLDGNTLTGTTDFFVTKYDSSGTKLYTKQTGTAGTNTYAYGVTVDGNGNAYVAGYTNGGLDGNTLVGTNDFFVTKYDPLGNKVYTKLTGVSGVDTYAYGVAVDTSGNVYVAGITGGGLDGNTLTGTTDFFLSKYDSSGNKLYTKQLGVAGTYTDAYGVAVDTSGNVYVAGYTYGGLDGNILAGWTDFFLVKYDSSGIKQYTKQLGVAGGTVSTEAYGVAVDTSGNVYVAGNTWGGLDGNTLTGTGDFFVTKYDASGNKVRTKQLGTAGKSTHATGVTVDGSGNVFVAGQTDGGLDGNTLTGIRDFFITKYDPAGNKQ